MKDRRRERWEMVATGLLEGNSHEMRVISRAHSHGVFFFG